MLRCKLNVYQNIFWRKAGKKIILISVQGSFSRGKYHHVISAKHTPDIVLYISILLKELEKYCGNSSQDLDIAVAFCPHWRFLMLRNVASTCAYIYASIANPQVTKPITKPTGLIPKIRKRYEWALCRLVPRSMEKTLIYLKELANRRLVKERRWLFPTSPW